MRDGRGVSGTRALEQKKLWLWPSSHLEAQSFRPLELLFEHVTWVSHEGFAVRQVNVTNQPRHFTACGIFFRKLREHQKSAQVRLEQHVGFFDAGKSFNARAVKGHFPLERFGKLPRRYLYIFDDAQNIGELEA